MQFVALKEVPFNGIDSFSLCVQFFRKQRLGKKKMTTTFRTLLALGAATATIGLGMPAASAPSTIGAPQWVAKPTGATIERYYPVKAKLAARNGKAAMRCSVTAKGTVENCRILSETPKPYGFGDSLLTMARFFQMKPQDANGNPVEGMDVTIQLSFYVK